MNEILFENIVKYFSLGGIGLLTLIIVLRRKKK